MHFKWKKSVLTQEAINGIIQYLRKSNEGNKTDQRRNENYNTVKQSKNWFLKLKREQEATRPQTIKNKKEKAQQSI